MAKTLVVGDSVAVGIGSAISGAQVFAKSGLRINQMQSYFDQAIAAAGQGDTVIISAGYNSTGPNGISQADLALLQKNIDQLAAKGAKVVIAPLRESGMTGTYARLNGQTVKTNQQLRTLVKENIIVADGCVAAANGIAGGEIHGAYPDLARICQLAATAAAAATSAGKTEEEESEARKRASSGAAPAPSSGGGLWDFLSSILEWIVGIFTSLFGGGAAASPTASTPATPPASSSATESPSDPQKAKEQAAAAAPPKTKVEDGQNVESNTPPAGTPPVGQQAVPQR